MTGQQARATVYVQEVMLGSGPATGPGSSVERPRAATYHATFRCVAKSNHAILIICSQKAVWRGRTTKGRMRQHPEEWRHDSRNSRVWHTECSHLRVHAATWQRARREACSRTGTHLPAAHKQSCPLNRPSCGHQSWVTQLTMPFPLRFLGDSDMQRCNAEGSHVRPAVLTYRYVLLCLQAPRQHKPGAHCQQASCSCSCQHAQHGAATAEHPMAGASRALQHPLGELPLTVCIYGWHPYNCIHLSAWNGSTS